jgi:hypothetical protein
MRVILRPFESVCNDDGRRVDADARLPHPARDSGARPIRQEYRWSGGVQHGLRAPAGAIAPRAVAVPPPAESIASGQPAFPVNGQLVADNIFGMEQGPHGAESILSFTLAVTEEGPWLSHD